MIKLIIATLAVLLTVPAQAKGLNDSESVYTFLADSLPDVVESAGGLSTSIELMDLTCSFSNVRNKDVPEIKSSCIATKLNGDVVNSSGDVSNLIFVLINAGLPFDRASEPGTTYVSAKNLGCVRIECKSANPADCVNVPVSFECTAY